MKNLLLPLMLLLSFNIFADSSILLKGGGSFNGTFSEEYWEKDTKTSLNYQGVVELQKDLNKYISVGFGTGYYQGAELEKLGSESTSYSENNLVLFNSIPTYVTGQIYFLNSKIMRPYLKLNYGYSYNLKSELAKKLDVDIEDGEYYGVGFGVEIKSLILEVVYEVNEAGIYVDHSIKKTDYRRISAFVGLKF